MPFPTIRPDIATVASCAVLLVLSACASQPQAATGFRPDPMRLDSLMERTDADGDAILSIAEIETVRLKQFTRFDRDKNAVLTPDEIRQLYLGTGLRPEKPESMTRNRLAAPPQRGDRAGSGRSPMRSQSRPQSSSGDANWIAAMDRNGDRRISLNEWDGLDGPILMRSDFDGDGNVTRAELDEAVGRWFGWRWVGDIDDFDRDAGP